MDPQTLKNIGTVLYYFSSPVATAPIVNGASQGEVFIPLLNTVQILAGYTDTLEGFAKLGKYAPLVGIGLSSVSLVNNVSKIVQDINAGFQPKQSDYYGALADAAGIISAAALALAGASAIAAASPILITAGVVAAVVSATLTVASIAAGQHTIDLQAMYSDMQSSFAQMKGAAGDAWDSSIEEIHEGLNSGTELYSVISSYLEEQGEFIKNSLLDGAGEISNSFDDLLQSLSNSFEDALHTVSPLVLDLNGDGFKMTGLTSATFFDHDANGVKEKTGWMDNHDGMLVRDLNNNGTIDSGLELFGNNTLLSNGKDAANGFEALRELDSNRDGVFDARDVAYIDLKVWVDANGDAQSDIGELHALTELGIEKIDLLYSSANVLDSNGNRILQVGTYFSSGTSKAIADEWFVTDPSTNIILDGRSASGPNLPGTGLVASLQQEIATGNYRLQNLLEEFQAASTEQERSHISNEIIYEWTGANQHDSVSRGSYIDDGRKLFALEALMGKKFTQASGTNLGTTSPGPNAAALLIVAYSKLSEFVKSSLMLQITYSDLMEGLRFSLDGNSYNLNSDAVLLSLQAKFISDPIAGSEYLDGYVKSLKIAGGDLGGPLLEKLGSYEALPGNEFGLALHYALGKHYDIEMIEQYGSVNSDVLQGITGSDIIYGDNGNDIIIGGAGSDYLSGDGGVDTYKFSLGWGKDSINVMADDRASDILEFGNEVSPDGFILSRIDDSLLLSYLNGDTVTLVNYFFSGGVFPSPSISVRFYDGRIWTNDHIRQLVAGHSLNDSIEGTRSADVISTGAGNDVINASDGNDVLDGGTGNDLLNGGVGSDRYVFSAGDGKDIINETSVSTTSSSNDIDTIFFLSGIAPSDVTLGASGTNLLLSYNDGLDNVSIQGWFSSSYNRYQVERVEFSDGTVWLASDLTSKFNYFNGTDAAETLDRSALAFAQQIYGNGGYDNLFTGTGSDIVSGGHGNDTLNSGSGADQLTGGAGNDTLSGGLGSDVYFFNLGDGQDIIQETSQYSSLNDGAVDVLKFGAGVSAADITISASGYDV
ncbi:calcium-binding protein, partial [Pseudomonas syringae group genomosp. 3]